MRTRKAKRFEKLLAKKFLSRSGGFGCMHGMVVEIGDIVGPGWGDEPCDAQLGIAYHGESGPVYYTGNGIETTDET